MTTIRIAALAAALTGASLGLAGPASAQLDAGNYSFTVTNDSDGDSGYGGAESVDPCGQNCVHVTERKVDYELHLKGNTWSGSYDGGQCGTATVTIDNTTLAGRDTCGASWVEYQLVKEG